jgi:hypothetical protein
VRIEADSILPYSRDVVFRAYRDDLPKVVEFLPNVRSIEVKKRDEAGPVTTLFNVWHGGGEVPAAARALLDEKALSWDDHAIWDESKHQCDWTIHTHAFTDAVTSKGQTKLIELAPDRTRIELRGEFAIDLKKVRGIPSFLAGSVGKAVEGFLSKQITANLTSTTDALSRYLAKKTGAA